MEDNMKPSLIEGIVQSIDRLYKFGLTEDDILTLIQKRIKEKPSKKIIREIINAIKMLENQLNKKEKGKIK